MKHFYTFSAIFILLIGLIGTADAQDGEAPTITLSGPTETQNAAFDVTITFSGNVLDFAMDDIVLTGDAEAAVTGLTDIKKGGDEPTATATIRPAADQAGNVIIHIPADAVQLGIIGNEASNEVVVPVDTKSPTVDSMTVAPTISGQTEPFKDAFTVTITFDEPVTGLEASDLRVLSKSDNRSAATLITDFVATDPTAEDYTAEYTVTISPPQRDDETLTIQVPAGVCTDEVGNDNADSYELEVSVDGKRPTVESIEVPEGDQNDLFDVTIEFSEDVVGFDREDVGVTQGLATVLDFTGSNDSYTATIRPAANQEGDVTIRVVAGGVTDAAGNGNVEFTATDSVHIDTIAPGVVSITDVPTEEQNGEFNVTITFSEDVEGFDTSAVGVTKGFATVSSFTGSDDSYTATIRPAANQEGDVTIRVVAGGVTDAAGNGNAEFIATPSVHIDTRAPTVVEITDVPTEEQNGEFTVTITFSEDVEGFDTNAVGVTKGFATVSSFTGSDDSYTVTITPAANQEGDVTIRVVAGGVTDAAENGNAEFIATPSVHIDTRAPTVESIEVPEGEQNGAFDVTITFSEEVNGFAEGDITLTGPGEVALKSGSDRDSIYTVTITPEDNREGDITLQVGANTVKDFAQNDNTASDTATVHIDTIPPTVDSISNLPDMEKNVAFDITITFSEDVEGFGENDLMVTGEATATGTSGSDKVYTATITPNPGKEGKITIQVKANGVTDNAGNDNTEASAVTPQIHIDTMPPTVSIDGVPTIEKNVAFDITITFSEEVNGFVVDEDITLTGPGTVALKSGSDGDREYTATITPNATSEGDVKIKVDASAVQDFALNPNTASAERQVHVDTIVPTVSISGVPTIEKNVPFDLTITFSEPVDGFQASDVAVTFVREHGTVTDPPTATLKSGTQGPAIYTVTITPNADSEGDTTFQIPVDTVKDKALNANTASAITDTVHVDTIAPTVPTVEISGVPTEEKNVPFDITITFSEPVDGFEASDVVRTFVREHGTVTDPPTATLKSGTQGSMVYTVTITPNADSEGDTTFQIPVDTVKDKALNANTASAITDTVRVDTIVPTVSISGVPTEEQNVAFDVKITFSEAVNGFVVGDITLTGPGTVALKSGSDGDIEYTVTITPNATSEGEVTLQVGANTVKDFALNNNTVSNTPDVHIDTIVPTVEIIDVPEIEKNVAFDVKIKFSEAVNGFAVGDITLTGPGTVALKPGSDGDSEYTVTITPNATSEGEVTLQVGANKVKDFALNDNTVSNIPKVHIDTIIPTVEISDVPEIEKNVAFDVTITFSEAVNGFTVGDITLTGPGTVALKSGSDGDSRYIATVTPAATSEGEVTLQVGANTVKDFALNNNTVSNTPDVHIDTIVPTVEIRDVPEIEKNVAFDVTITFSEAVNGFVVGDITLTGPGTVALKSGGDGDSEYMATITPNATSEGEVTLQVGANTVKDFALNNNTVSNTPDVHIDTILPEVEIIDVPQTVQLEMFSVTIKFSEPVSKFELADITLSGDAVVETSELTPVDAVSESTYTLTITPHEDTDGDVTIEVPKDVAEDDATNLNTVSPPQTVSVAPRWIPDPNLRTVVREGIGLSEGEDFAREQLADLTTFNGFYREISDLTGLEYATELISTELTGNQINDLTALSDLTPLTTLVLDNNAISDVAALEGLVNLTTLNLAVNRVGDITPLEGLTALRTLNLSENLVSDLTPLSALTALTHLYLTSNGIRDVSPIVNLENLVVLEIAENPIERPDLLAELVKKIKASGEVPSVVSDRGLLAAVRRALKLSDGAAVTIPELRGLTTLELPPGDVDSLEGLEHATALTTLVLADNAITDITRLQGLTQLTSLDLSGNNITDVTPLADLAALTILDLSGNSITDITSLEALTRLTTLNLSNNPIRNFNPIVGLTGLTTLELSGNAINNLNVVSDLTRLRTLNLSDNSITNITQLQNLKALATLNLSGNTVRNLSPISSLTRLTDLDLSGNSISHNNLTPIAGLKQLSRLNLSDNTVSDLTLLAGLTNLTTLQLGGNTISSLSPLTTLKRLIVLDVNANNISDISPLTGLAELATLDVRANNISDVEPLVGLLNLETLRLAGNPVLETTVLYPLTQRVPPVAIDIAVFQYLQSDVNQDGKVDTADSELVTAALGQSGEDIVNPRTDVNGDGAVDDVDLQLVTSNFEEADGRAAPSSLQGITSLFLDVETLKTLDRDALQAQLEMLRAESDGSLKYQQAIAWVEAFLAALLPKQTRLLANYPNPFNPETWIPYQLAEASPVRIIIYDSRARVICRLDLGYQPPGYYTGRHRAAYWNGRNTLGESAASGIYFYQLQADNVSLLRKMLIVK